MLQATQGYIFKKEVSESSSQLILFDGVNKIIVTSLIEEEGKLYLTASADETQEWIPGKYTYQLLDDTGIEEEGIFKVKANLLFSTDIQSYWQKALKAVEDRIAGKTLDPARDIAVGDKRISYYTLDELLKLRAFIQQKIAEEAKEEGDINASSAINGKTISYIWRSW